MIILGIDIGKSEFHCALLAEQKQHTKHFPNSAKGFDQLAAWLRNRRVTSLHACMEATGGWSEELAAYLHGRGYIVSIVNPAAIRAFGQSELSRTKTDKADAELIARYCAAMQPPAWNPPSPTERRLRQLVRRRNALSEMLVQEKNRLDAPGTEAVAESIRSSIDFLQLQIRDLDSEIDRTIDDDPDLRAKRNLLETIPGISKRTSSALLGENPHMHEFRSAKALAAFAGLCPHERRSGTSISSCRLTPIGTRAIRRVLYMPAMTALRWNPPIAAMGQRLRARGKRPMQIIVAAMRKLLILAYGVLKSGQPFSPTHA